MHLDQIGIALTGVTAVFLTQSAHASRRRWAPVFGMIGQPFWFYAAVTAEQWGIVFVSALYTFAWAKGLWTHWIRPRIDVYHARQRHAKYCRADCGEHPSRATLAPHPRARTWHD